jgi:hypothetical protein
MPEQHLGAGIDRHDRIERARLGVAVELDEDLLEHCQTFAKNKKTPASGAGVTLALYACQLRPPVGTAAVSR